MCKYCDMFKPIGPKHDDYQLTKQQKENIQKTVDDLKEHLKKQGAI